MPHPKSNRKFNILFLIKQEKRKAYMEISFARDPSAVLRKHWRGENPLTRELFSRENAEAIPEMWVWSAGYMSRKEAVGCMLAWKQRFETEGYEILGDYSTLIPKEALPKMHGRELDMLGDISVLGLLEGRIGKCVECAKKDGKTLPATQKFTVEPADEFLKVRVQYETAKRFREMCNKDGVTQGQGLERLMAECSGDISPVVLDLQERLEKANTQLAKKDAKIDELRELLRKSEEAKEYPKKYRMAELQGNLLNAFFERLPSPQYLDKEKLHIYSSSSGKMAFPQGVGYSFPKEEGVVLLTLEHVRYSRGHPACIFLYGIDEKNNKLKIRWYPHKGNSFGESLRNSVFFYEHAPWLFAVQKQGDAMEMVGGLPDPEGIKRQQEEAELRYLERYVRKLVVESEELGKIHTVEPESPDLGKIYFELDEDDSEVRSGDEFDNGWDISGEDEEFDDFILEDHSDLSNRGPYQQNGFLDALIKEAEGKKK